MARRLRIGMLVVMALALAAASALRDDAPDRERSARAALPVDRLAEAQRHIAAREYWASPGEGRLQAPNRRHDLRTFFEPTGALVHARTSPGETLAGLRLVGLGRGDALAPVLPGEVTSHGGRVEIARASVREWLDNSVDGLEQGFVLEASPAGAGALVLELDVAPARASAFGDDVMLTTPAGRTLRYGALHVEDATGAALAARFELPAPDRVRLVVADAGARYPLVIDPLLSSTPDVILQSDQASARFGASAAGAGDVNGDGYDDVIVGAEAFDGGTLLEGAAFVFHGGPNGIVSGAAAAAATRLEGNRFLASFGARVAGAGDVNGDGYDDVIVGAPGYGASSGVYAGAAFVFHGSATGIANGDPTSAAASLVSPQDGSQFGSGVAGAGDVNADGYDDVIVGASVYTPGVNQEGAAFVFLGSVGGIASGGPATASATLQSDQPLTRFGWSVAGAGDVNADGFADVIVGAPDYDAGEIDEGAAFVFLGGPAGVASASAASAAATLQSDQMLSWLGQSVAGVGDVNGDGYADVMAGAHGYTAGLEREGAAFLFLGSAAGVPSGSSDTTAATLHAGQARARMGWSVAGAGDVNGDGYADVIVGANRFSDGETSEGAAFVFLGSATGLASGGPALAASHLQLDQTAAELGASVAGAGDVNGDGYADVLAGADLGDAGQSNEGLALVYHGSATGLVDGTPATASARIEADQAGAELAVSVSDAGDVNGDGYGDVIVGAPKFDAGQPDEGAAFVLLGSATGIADASPTAVATTLQANQPDALLGRSVSGAGDVNGDGYGDVIVGAPGYDAGQPNEGAAFVFHGSAAGVANGDPTTAATRVESNQDDAALGTSVSDAGDTNGDGYADVIVGAPGWSAGQANEGAAFLFFGSASGIAHGGPSTAAARLESDQEEAGLGESVSAAGDVNGDGYADVIVGAPAYDAGEPDEGAAFVLAGSAAGIPSGGPSLAAARFESDQSGAELGASVAAAGDVNGDGHGDAIVGAPGYDAGEVDEGTVFVLAGSAAGIASGGPPSAAVQIDSDQAGAELGWSVSGAGDVNGDGYADVIAGAPFFTTGATPAGAALLLTGDPSWVAGGSPSTILALLASDQASSGLGLGASGAGDVNGDGFADVIVGAPGYDAGQGSGEGAAFVFLGNAGRNGRPVLARQGNAGSFVAQQPWGRSTSATGFDVEMQASHPAGRGRVALEIEWCAAGVAFGDARCGHAQSAFVAVGGAAPSVARLASASGLAPDTLQRWRARVLHAASTGSTTRARHGPWRRVHAQSVEADLRTASSAPPDADHDGVGDASDNCPSVANADQQDTGGLGSSAPADGIGDACQCGDVTADGRVTTADAVVIARSLLVPPTATPARPEHCDVGGSAGCTNADVVILRRALLVPPTATITQQCVEAP